MVDPNPIELYEAAVQKMLPIIGNVASGQLADATPCSDWSVKNLIIHNLKVTEFAAAAFRGDSAGNPMEMMQVDGDLPSEGAGGAFEAATKSILDAVKAAGALDKTVQSPMGEMPAGQFLMLPFGDIVIHKWDLAKATGQETSLDANLAEACFNVMSAGIAQGREIGFFGPEVEIAANSSIQDKLLGLSGRQP